jgi:hypothetical protein
MAGVLDRHPFRKAVPDFADPDFEVLAKLVICLSEFAFLAVRVERRIAKLGVSVTIPPSSPA